MEFKEAMKITNTMCEYYMSNSECKNCPLNSINNGKKCSCSTCIQIYPDVVEKVILQWEKDHPVETNLQHYKKVVVPFIKDTFSEENKSTGLCTPYKMPITFCNNGDSCKKCTEWWNSPYRKEKQNEAD